MGFYAMSPHSAHDFKRLGVLAPRFRLLLLALPAILGWLLDLGTPFRTAPSINTGEQPPGGTAPPGSWRGTPGRRRPSTAFRSAKSAARCVLAPAQTAPCTAPHVVCARAHSSRPPPLTFLAPGAAPLEPCSSDAKPLRDSPKKSVWKRRSSSACIFRLGASEDCGQHRFL